MISRFAAAQRANVPPFHVMDVLASAAERQRTHGDLLNLAAGQPSTGAPAPVTAEAVRLLQSGDPLGYTPATGIVELRTAIAGLYLSRYGVRLDPDDVVVTTGSSGGFLLAFLAAFEVGDRVAIARPGYPCYRNVLTALGCEVVEIPTGAASRFQPTVAQLAALHAQAPFRGLIVASPANPTGTMLPPEELAAIARWCEEHDVQLVSDEIYHGISYGSRDGVSRRSQSDLLDQRNPSSTTEDGGRGGALAPSRDHRDHSAWETSRESIVFGSFSKYFSMTGWRLGWMVVPERLRRAVDVLTGNFSICPPALAQHAAIAAFAPESIEELDGHVERYARNRAVLLDGLHRLGLDDLAPADGAFYAWANVEHLTRDSLGYSRKLLASTGVALTTGIDFDTAEGGHYLRFSFAGTTDTITSALDRLDGALRPS